jgi:hypothetical protein
MESITQTLEYTTWPTQQANRGGTSQSSSYRAVPIRSAEQSIQDEQAQKAAVQQQLLERMQAKNSSIIICKPPAYCPPAYNTPEYWRDCTRGWISDDEQRQHHADHEIRRRRALASRHRKAPAPLRHLRSAPRDSKQFSKSMATLAARDDRLTPQSKALLQVLVARTGRGRFTDTTKTTLSLIMSRCPRSIQRYLQELIQFGYIRTQTRKSKRTGFFIGVRIWIMNSVLPFFAQQNADYAPEKWRDFGQSRRKPEETKESLTNIKQIYLSAFSDKKPPWFDEFAF